MNKEKKKITDRIHYLKTREILRNYKREFKKDKCCSICGYRKNPSILSFHHIKDKKFAIAKLLNSLNNLKKEIEKCVLLCPNCHMEIHQNNGI